MLGQDNRESRLKLVIPKACEKLELQRLLDTADLSIFTCRSGAGPQVGYGASNMYKYTYIHTYIIICFPRI